MVTQQLQRCQVTGAPQQLLKSVAHRHHGHQGRSTNVLIPIERPGLGHILQGRIVDDNYRVVRQGTIWFQIAPVDLLGFQHIHLGAADDKHTLHWHVIQCVNFVSSHHVIQHSRTHRRLLHHVTWDPMQINNQLTAVTATCCSIMLWNPNCWPWQSISLELNLKTSCLKLLINPVAGCFICRAARQVRGTELRVVLHQLGQRCL
mmetsp:Transcript_45241/g.98452  ORF Transcript_45241/g.98452 Transcript_45241/m.98452 type:complete len:204 (+) Transcript_45241:1157-1768(+)